VNWPQAKTKSKFRRSQPGLGWALQLLNKKNIEKTDGTNQNWVLMLSWKRIVVIAVGLGAWHWMVAQEKNPFGKEPLPKAVIVDVAPGVKRVGAVTLDANKKQISLPVAINMNDGPLEYLVVTGKGKTHESLLVTHAEPFHIKVAMLLLNCKGSDGRLIPEDDEKPIPGEQVKVELHWKEEDQQKKSALEHFVQRVDKKKVTEGPFVFNGSRVFQGTFLAQRDGSVVSLITDNAALFNNPRLGRDDDEIWRPQAKGLPPLDSNGTLVIKILKKTKNEKQN
jgi:hypothetical protein